MKYPVAEIFSSLQGEGAYVGAKMLFVRLAGCTVGKPFTKEEKSLLPILPFNGHEKCTAWNGESFVCDTVYKAQHKLSAEEICEHLNGERIVCITGGEPLMHNLEPLVTTILSKGLRVHFETSGTWSLTPIMSLGTGKQLWITVSPKFDYLEQALIEADEIKVLVERKTFNEKEFVERFEEHMNKVWLQPVNDILKIDQDNLWYSIKLIDKYPQVRLSVQLHKWLNIQ
jgi:7-carboxy-7-deazaguanine synthase